MTTDGVGGGGGGCTLTRPLRDIQLQVTKSKARLRYAKMAMACGNFVVCTVAYRILSLAFDLGHSACWPHQE